MRLTSVIDCDSEYRVGLANPRARVGDKILLLPGCSVPVILRKQHENNQFKLVGDAILHGMMSGEKCKPRKEWLWHEPEPDFGPPVDLHETEII